MARQIRLPVGVDVSEARADLESIKLGLGREVTRTMRDIADLLAGMVAQEAPVGPGPYHRRDGQRSTDDLPHLDRTFRGAVEAATALVVSSHPAAGVLEWGGTIAPKHTPFHITQHGYAHKTAEQHIGQIEELMTERLDALIAEHGA